MRFRQVHLDFHTSEAIRQIGVKFSKKQFQTMLEKGHVDSVTVFAKCHHGWAYHPSKANETHPHLGFNLVGEMIEAAHEIGVLTPIYISAGLDEKLARQRPEWLIRDKQERTTWASDFMSPGYHQLCMNTPYLDILVAQIEEVVSQYDADGIFLDIVGVRECYCQQCVRSVRDEDGDPRDYEAMRRIWESTYIRYATRANEAVHKYKTRLPVFHNNGHIMKGRRDLAELNSHLELESLPTGGWGYDHFPLSARYAQTLGLEYLGMTGKFHTSWGEFGGFKHPNALRSETSLNLAHGAKCSIGDQLHPNGEMNEATYALIGAAYREVEQKEAWCEDVVNVADIAVLSWEAVQAAAGVYKETRDNLCDAGAVRILLEGQYLFDVIDLDADFSAYKVIVLPDRIRLDEKISERLNQFFKQGGKVFASGCSGLMPNENRFAIDLGVEWTGVNRFKPSYFRSRFELEHVQDSAFVFYTESQLIRLTSGSELGYVENPYFNRDIFTFSSHQHTPNDPVHAGTAMSESHNGIYFAWNVFEEYATVGSLIAKETVRFALDRLLAGNKTAEIGLPSQGIATMQYQQKFNRWINHLLYMVPIKRGSGIEVIEDIVPLFDIDVRVNVPYEVKSVYLAPSHMQLPFTQDGRTVSYRVPKIDGHQMVVLQF